MSAKKLTSLLPPKRPAKRTAGVNVRFTQDEYDELEQIAEYRSITTTELIYHVISQVALPELREEMEAEIAANTEQELLGGSSQPADSSNHQPELLPPHVDLKNPHGNPIRNGTKLPQTANTAASGDSST